MIPCSCADVECTTCAFNMGFPAGRFAAISLRPILPVSSIMLHIILVTYRRIADMLQPRGSALLAQLHWASACPRFEYRAFKSFMKLICNCRQYQGKLGYGLPIIRS